MASQTALAIQEYHSWWTDLRQSRGLKAAVQALKDLYSRCKLLVIKAEVPRKSFGGQWIKLNAEGLPQRLPNLTALLTGGVWQRRIAISIVQSVELLRLSPSLQIDSITTAFYGNNQELAYWSRWCEDYSKHIWLQSFKPVPSNGQIHTSVSASPNGGPSIMMAARDVQPIMENPSEREKFERWCVTFGRQDLWNLAVQTYCDLVTVGPHTQAKEFLEPKGELHLASLIYLADKAGKTRVVYCLNWWYQELLQPIHNSLYKLLYTIDEDGTKSHKGAADKVKLWTLIGRKLWSVDLSNATDRFPKELQEAVIRGLLGAELAQVWSEIMAVRPWSKPHKQYIEYSVGQPIGQKTSWAIFALAHHTVLRLICHYHAVPRDYVIIGDDIVIANETIYNSYMSFLNDLGVPYSPDKSVSPYGDTNSNQEFAKRLLLNGVEMSPLTPNLLVRIWKHRDYSVFLSLLSELDSKWGLSIILDSIVLHLHPLISAFLETLPKVERNMLTNAICGPEHVGALERGNLCCPGAVKYDNPFKGIDTLTFLHYLGSEVANRLQRYVDLLTEIKKVGIDTGGPLTGTAAQSFLKIYGPFKLVTNQLDQAIKVQYQGVANGDLNLHMVTTLGLDLEYLSELARYGRSWTQYKRLLQERRNRSTTKFWNRVLAEANTENQDPSFVEEEWWD